MKEILCGILTGLMMCGANILAQEFVPPLPEEDSFDILERRYREEATVEECLKLVSGVNGEYAARRVHYRALEEPLAYEREKCFVQILRLLGAELCRSAERETVEPTLCELRTRLRQVVVFDEHSGYVDADTRGPFEPEKAHSNAKFRGPRSLAVRLEALRALEEVCEFREEGFPITREDVYRLVLDFNPTEVVSSRGDPAIRDHRDWKIWERAETTLFTALLHFPEDPEAVTLLVSAVNDYRPGAVWTEAALTTAVGFFGNELMTASAEEQATLLAYLQQGYYNEEPLEKLPERLVPLLGALRELVFRARTGGTEFLPENWVELRKEDPEKFLALWSKSRRVGIEGAGWLVERLIMIGETADSTNVEQRLHQALCVRSRWLKCWDPARNVESAQNLAKVGSCLLTYLEESIPDTEFLPTLEDKAILCARIISIYQSRYVGRTEELDAAERRLGNRLFFFDGESFLERLRFGRTRWLIYERFKDPQRNSISGEVYERHLKNPPKDIQEAASAYARERELKLMNLINEELAFELRGRNRYPILYRLGFSHLDINELAKNEEKAGLLEKRSRR